MKTQQDSKETNKTGAAAFMEGARDKLNESEVVKTAIAIPLNKIRPNSNQPRKTFDKGPLNELSADIKMRGVREPITVTKINDTESDFLFEIVKGERKMARIRIGRAHRDTRIHRRRTGQRWRYDQRKANCHLRCPRAYGKIPHFALESMVILGIRILRTRSRTARYY